LVKQPNALTILHPEDQTDFFLNVLDFGQVVAD
jgi:hypothetical protein